MDYTEQEVSLNQIAMSSELFCLWNGLSLTGVVPSFYKLGDYEEEVKCTGSWGTLFVALHIGDILL